MAEILNNSNTDDKVKCIILTGAGKNFCSGNDLTNFMLFPPEHMSNLASRK